MLSGGPDESVKDVMVDAQGRAVTVGSVNGDFQVHRWLPDGTLDSSLDDGSNLGGGGARVGFSGTERAEAVAIQPGGKIVVVGSTSVDPVGTGTGDDNFAVIRLNENGTLDETFNNVAVPERANGDGAVTVDMGGTGAEDRAFDVQIRPDGKILVVGGSNIGAGGDFAALQLLPNGKADPDFNFGSSADGVAIVDFGSEEGARGAAIQPDGKAVLGGTTSSTVGADPGGNLAVLRLGTDGHPDAGFGSDVTHPGTVKVGFGDDEQGKSVVVQPDGKIVVGGTWIGGDTSFALARLLSTGELDTSFNDIATPSATSGDGRLLVSFGGNDTLGDLTLQAEGKLLAVGSTDAGSDPTDAVVGQVLLDGTFDPAFGIGGHAHIGLVDDQDIHAAAVMADGNVMIAGETDNDGGNPGGSLPNTFLARILDAPPPAVSISDASVTEGNAGTTDAVFTVTLSKPSNKIVNVGFSTSGATASAGSDFDSASGTLTFAPGETSRTVAVKVHGDTAVEPDETFGAGLAGAVNATVGDGQGVGTILADDIMLLAPAFNGPVSLSPKTFAAAAKGGSVRPAVKVGTRVTYKLSEEARVRWGVQRRATGRKVGKKCRKPNAKNRGKRRCARFVTVRGGFTTSGKAGKNTFKFSGRLRGKKLPPARYRLTARATDAGGRKSKTATAGFRIVRR